MFLSYNYVVFKNYIYNENFLDLDFIYLKVIELVRFFYRFINFKNLIEYTCKKIKRANSITNEKNDLKKTTLYSLNN